MKSPYRPTPRTLDDAFGHPPSYYQPRETYTKPFYERLYFWALAFTACALAAIYLGVNYA